MKKVLEYLNKNKDKLVLLDPFFKQEEDGIFIYPVRKKDFSQKEIAALIDSCLKLVESNDVEELICSYHSNDKNINLSIFYGEDKNLSLGFKDINVFKKKIIEDKPFLAKLSENPPLKKETKRGSKIIIDYKEEYTGKKNKILNSIIYCQEGVKLLLSGNSFLTQSYIYADNLDNCIKKLEQELANIGIELLNTEIVPYKEKEINSKTYDYVPVQCEISCSIEFSQDDYDLIKKGFDATMDKKWAIISEGSHTFLIRSWQTINYELIFEKNTLKKIIAYDMLPENCDNKKEKEFVFRVIKNSLGIDIKDE